MKPGYCTNIHSGASFQSVIENLLTYSLPIKKAFCPDESMGIGLWFSQQAVREALDGDNWQQLNEFLQQHSLIANTFNAFPYSDFHQPVVKHAVYLPTWADPGRLQYTLDIAELQARLLGGHPVGSISTLPIGWPSGNNGQQVLADAAQNIVKCALGLSELAHRTGTRLRLAIEPEPGCLIDTSSKLVDFFQDYLLPGNDEKLVRSFAGVCHDVCHSAVMFETQELALSSYKEAGIEIAKIQISSAITAEFGNTATNPVPFNALTAFVEPRYLHQTTIRTCDDELLFFEDLAPALSASMSLPPPFSSRTHFHVPIHLKQIGDLGTTRGEILECLAWVAANRDSTGGTDIEVETYAWDVAPDSAKKGTLIETVVDELRFLDSIMGGNASAL